MKKALVVLIVFLVTLGSAAIACTILVSVKTPW